MNIRITINSNKSNLSYNDLFPTSKIYYMGTWIFPK